MHYTKTTKLILCAVFAAITGICSGIIIPLPFTPVPITLATLAVMLTGSLLGSRYGSLSMIVYLLLGAFGAPVFKGYTGGFGNLVGPTGGYLLGYLLTAFLTGLIIEKLNKKNNLYIHAAAMAIGLSTCYLLGTAWFMFSTNTDLWTALVSCVLPFLLADALKITAGALLTVKLRAALDR
ncbi:biotin transporter BioY [Aminipila butyrica]|uniref:Biotin transporter n=1 Tax=Aminipila butyrica TaxID=433296 RepID=A0A858BYM5_9FIRM|nr:biotin transporter BioY [Aminipila butyrica]QIB70319.1 biotin transporter BioY [Aminipila butyrica]